MYHNILSEDQKVLLPWLIKFKKKFVLVGGTAIALQIGHRSSIDFDLFCTTPLNKATIKKAVKEIAFEKRLLFEDSESLHFMINNVKITFFYYPFSIQGSISAGGFIFMPELDELAAMKFYAMGRRAKWKDYVDIYFILKYHYSIPEISIIASNLFGEAFAEKLFRQQLVYFEDIDYSETLEWVKPEIDSKTIREELTVFALQF